MIKICIIMQQFFPVPAVKGGASEQLVNCLADENEKEKKIDITIISIFDSEAVKASKLYKNSKFEFIPIKEKEGEFDYSSTDDSFKEYKFKIEKYLENQDFDYIISVGGKKEHVIESIPYRKRITYLHGPEIDGSLSQYYNKLIVVSDYIANRYYKETDIPSNSIITLNNAIHIDNFNIKLNNEEKRKLKNKYNIGEDNIVISFCGRTSPKKGVEELIRAFKNVNQLKKSKLIVVGNRNFAKQVITSFEEKLFDIAKDIQDRVVFTGFIPNTELYKIHNISDIAVIPSIFNEPFGLTVIEAMASGLPLIVSDAGAIPDLVTKENAIIVNRGEYFIPELTKAMDKLISDSNLRIQMGNASRAMSLKYDTPQFYNNFVQIIQKIKSEEV